jgi:hypothetical protein
LFCGEITEFKIKSIEKRDRFARVRPIPACAAALNRPVQRRLSPHYESEGNIKGRFRQTMHHIHSSPQPTNIKQHTKMAFKVRFVKGRISFSFCFIQNLGISKSSPFANYLNISFLIPISEI